MGLEDEPHWPDSLSQDRKDIALLRARLFRERMARFFGTITTIEGGPFMPPSMDRPMTDEEIIEAARVHRELTASMIADGTMLPEESIE